jgi:ABC-type sugar transport system ATPase subunit
VIVSIEFRDVAVELRPRRIRDQRRRPFDGLSVKVDDSEIVALVGGRGFGGTTAARLAAGVVSPDSGVLEVNHVDVTDVPAARRPVGLIPAGGGLLPQLTAEDNITYGPRLRGEPAEVIRPRLAEAAERLELRPLLSLRPHELSAGQRLRVALARAAVRSVHALAVDATAGSAGLARLRHVIALAWPDAAVSTLLCAHDRAVFSQADRVVVVDDGRAGASGTPEQMVAEPPDLATARLVHRPPTPEISGVVRGGRIECGALRLPAPAGLREGCDVLVALTADAVDLVAAGHGLPAEIVTVERTGATVHVLVEPADCRGSRWPAEWTQSSRPRVGEQVGICVAAERLLVFDAGDEGHPRLAPGAGG